ncbi:PEP-CTERM sorting domain-containing protein [Candidatus Spyradosoma sp. SGI.093]|uniref:PEP-CTERM sorting domain-containing protein n=1 Tax=Candidatus Spyradosoma sp. SGI.093 TaxID=3420583 RepID=UPI003D07E7E6
MKHIIAITFLLAAGTLLANAENIDVTTTRTQINRTQATSVAGNTYNVSTGQVFLSGWDGSNTVATSFDINFILNGTGCVGDAYYDGEITAALRLGDKATVAGQVTIGGDTHIWSTTAENGISGNIVTADLDSTVTLMGTLTGTNNAQVSSSLLVLSGSSIVLPTLDVQQYASLKFDSSDIAFSSITGQGAVSFAENSKINLKEGETLSIAAGTLAFGSTTLTSSMDNDTLLGAVSDYFKGAAISSVSFIGNVLTIEAIPEPSAFGLLAGLGALALAGTRRRRRK